MSCPVLFHGICTTAIDMMHEARKAVPVITKIFFITFSLLLVLRL
jgi:hypothetical protein